MSRRLFSLAVVLAAAWLTVQAQTQTPPGAPSRPFTAPPQLAPVNQPGVILGTVIESATGRGIPRAIVRIAGRGIGVTRVTDDRGRFYFVAVPEGDVEITATKSGYFDGAFGKRRAGGRGLPLTMTPGRWVTDVQIELFKGAAINGVVSDESGEGIAGVRVQGWRREYVEGREQLIPAAEVLTNDDGVYRIFGLQPGAYIISVPSVQVTIPADAISPTQSVTPAQSVAPELWALLNLNRATAAEDRITQPDGKYVLAVGGNPTPPPPNPNGALAYQTEFYPGFDSPLPALPIEVRSGEDRVGVHFQLRLVPTRRVSGIVTGPNGPLARQLVRVVVEGADDNGFGSEAATTISGTDGAFTLLNVPEGRYVLQVRTLKGVLSAASSAIPAADGFLAEPPVKAWAQQDLIVGNRDVADVILQVRPCLTISGQLLLEGNTRRPSASGVRVTLLPASRAIGAAVTKPLAPDGTFEFSDLVPGSYFVRASGLPLGWGLKSITSGARELLDAPIEIDGDTEVNIAITDRPGELWGTVRDVRGAHSPGATVLVVPAAGANPNRMRETRAATSGIFSVSSMPPGDYYVLAIDDALAEGWQDPRRVDALRAIGTRMSVRVGERRMIDLTLQVPVRR